MKVKAQPINLPLGKLFNNSINKLQNDIRYLKHKKNIIVSFLNILKEIFLKTWNTVKEVTGQISKLDVHM